MSYPSCSQFGGDPGLLAINIAGLYEPAIYWNIINSSGTGVLPICVLGWVVTWNHSCWPPTELYQPTNLLLNTNGIPYQHRYKSGTQNPLTLLLLEWWPGAARIKRHNLT